MSQYRKNKPSSLSKGNQQRIGLALALVTQPDVVILDEPFSGLDPVNAMHLRSLIDELAGSGRLVIISSHQMSAIENICDHVVILNGGKIVLDSTLGELRNENRTGIIKIHTTDDNAARLAASTFGETTPLRDGFSVKLRSADSQKALLDALQKVPAELLHFEVSAPSLEELFVTLCGGEPTAAKTLAGGDLNE